MLQVIYHLNSRNEDLEHELHEQAERYEAEVAQVRQGPHS